MVLLHFTYIRDTIPCPHTYTDVHYSLVLLLTHYYRAALNAYLPAQP